MDFTELERAHKLLEEKAISQEVYDAIKARILNSAQQNPEITRQSGQQFSQTTPSKKKDIIANQLSFVFGLIGAALFIVSALTFYQAFVPSEIVLRLGLIALAISLALLGYKQ